MDEASGHVIRCSDMGQRPGVSAAPPELNTPQTGNVFPLHSPPHTHTDPNRREIPRMHFKVLQEPQKKTGCEFPARSCLLTSSGRTSADLPALQTSLLHAEVSVTPHDQSQAPHANKSLSQR